MVRPSPASHRHPGDRDGGSTPPVISAGRRDRFLTRENVTRRKRVTVMTQRWSFRALGLDRGRERVQTCAPGVPRPGNRLAPHRRLLRKCDISHGKAEKPSFLAAEPSLSAPPRRCRDVITALLAAGTVCTEPGDQGQPPRSVELGLAVEESMRLSSEGLAELSPTAKADDGRGLKGVVSGVEGRAPNSGPTQGSERAGGQQRRAAAGGGCA